MKHAYLYFRAEAARAAEVSALIDQRLALARAWAVSRGLMMRTLKRFREDSKRPGLVVWMEIYENLPSDVTAVKDLLSSLAQAESGQDLAEIVTGEVVAEVFEDPPCA